MLSDRDIAVKSGAKGAVILTYKNTKKELEKIKVKENDVLVIAFV